MFGNQEYKIERTQIKQKAKPVMLLVSFRYPFGGYPPSGGNPLEFSVSIM